MSLPGFASRGEMNNSKRIRHLSLLYAGILIISAVAVLFYYSEFQTFILSVTPRENEVVAYVVSALFVTSGVFSLPYVLGMRLPALIRQLSRVCGFVVPLLIGVVGVFMTTNQSVASTYAILPENMIGIWLLCASVALLLLAVWVSWGESSHSSDK